MRQVQQMAERRLGSLDQKSTHGLAERRSCVPRGLTKVPGACIDFGSPDLKCDLFTTRVAILGLAGLGRLKRGNWQLLILPSAVLCTRDSSPKRRSMSLSAAPSSPSSPRTPSVHGLRLCRIVALILRLKVELNAALIRYHTRLRRSNAGVGKALKISCESNGICLTPHLLNKRRVWYP